MTDSVENGPNPKRPEDRYRRTQGKGHYAPGNTREDGSYRIGKGRTPEHSRYRVGDERPRGRRPKGKRNFDTDFQEEARRLVTIRESGKERRVTKQRAVVIRLFDGALAKGDPRSQALVFSHATRIGDTQTTHAVPSSPDDEELNAWLRQRLALIENSELATPEEQSDASQSSSAIGESASE